MFFFLKLGIHTHLDVITNLLNFNSFEYYLGYELNSES